MTGEDEAARRRAARERVASLLLNELKGDAKEEWYYIVIVSPVLVGGVFVQGRGPTDAWVRFHGLNFCPRDAETKTIGPVPTVSMDRVPAEMRYRPLGRAEVEALEKTLQEKESQMPDGRQTLPRATEDEVVRLLIAGSPDEADDAGRELDYRLRHGGVAPYAMVILREFQKDGLLTRPAADRKRRARELIQGRDLDTLLAAEPGTLEKLFNLTDA